MMAHRVERLGFQQLSNVTEGEEVHMTAAEGRRIPGCLREAAAENKRPDIGEEADVRSGQIDVSAGTQHARDLADEARGVLNVLDHLEAQHRVERAVVERELLRVEIDAARRHTSSLRLGEGVVVRVDPVNRAKARREEPRDGRSAAADIEEALAGLDERESRLLPQAPREEDHLAVG